MTSNAPNEITESSEAPQRLAICSQKGGVGKTTVALNLALSLAERGLKTLLVDVDPQGAIGHSLRRGDRELPGIADIIAGVVEAPAAILNTKLETLRLLPRGRLDPIDVPAFERALSSDGNGDGLASILDQAAAGVDRVLIDTPAGLGMVTREAMRLSHFVLIPAQAEPLALKSFHQVLRVVDHVRREENPNLKLLGVLPTMVDLKNAPSHTVLMELWEGFSGVLQTMIPRTSVFADASAQGAPLAYLPGALAPEARRFELLANEIEDLIGRYSPDHKRSAAHDRPARQLL